MSDSPHVPGDADDRMLLAQLRLDPSHDDAWRLLTATARDFAAQPQADGDTCWVQSTRGSDGVVTVGYPEYSARVQRACRALSDVGAVTPAYSWMQRRPPALPDDGTPPGAADAVRLATTIIRGERFCDGTIGQAVERGTLQAVLTSLAAWYDARRSG
ncbi:DUF6508 domain-containing protein [Streptomyces sp. DSM 42041]|uniref:DUF6508 domain-containing protein n=1 Tax=Streptomyces hazeniae TaxID=3075538 RepID=A0ABU2NRL2_9ACTN|nr:DUF6508 domain-containing protein [Streptomyces sp. DSM 42041]MDT0379384.1 DUF6508 domain-containing protein [Streptomyces sp. DSM 42041]